MIPSTQEILIYRSGREKPDVVPWGNFYEDHKGQPEWLRAVEERLGRGEDWEPEQARDGILRIALSRMWRD